MAEPGITRLARRLAEENNVDWRSLEGSGEAGQVVEMDVLDYLARVMAGEEAVDPTPEPLPEGMTSWPEQDTFQPDDAAAAAEPDGTAGDDFDFAEDIFLFDDDEDADVPPAGETQLQETQPPAEDGEDTSWLDGNDSDWLHGGDDDAPEESLFQAYPSSDEPASDTEPPQPAAQETPDGLERWPGFGGDDGLEAQKSVFGEDDKLDDFEFSDDDLLDLSFEDGELDDPWLLDEDLREFESGPLDESLEQQAGRTGAADAGTPEESFPPAALASGADDGEDEGEDDGEDDEALLLARRIEAAFESVADEPPAFEDLDEEFADDLTAAEESAADADLHAQAAPGDAFPVAAVPAEAPAPAPAPALVPAARGHVLRRHVDLTALAGACVFAEEEFPGTPATLLRGVFLQLAARRAAARSGFRPDAGTAALVTTDAAQPAIHELPEAAGFSALLEAVRASGAGQPHPPEGAAFVTADVSGLDVDELLFPFPVPAVVLGSARTNAGTDAKTAVLSLSGDYDITAGAVFLQELAGLLLSPVRILL